MTSGDSTPGVRRVVVLLDGSRHSRAVLDEAAAFAARERAELVGLFVEDTELLRAASLPFGGEIGLISGRLRRVEPGSLERRLHYQAARVRRLLAAAAHPHSIGWRLEVSRNRLDTAALAAAAEGDLLMLARLDWHERPRGEFTSTARRIASSARCTVMLLSRRTAAGEHPVLVFYERSEAGRRAREQAARLARRARQELVVLLTPATEYDDRELAELDEWAVRHGLPLRLVRLPGDDAPALTGVLRRERAGALVMQRDHRLLQDAAGERLLDTLDTPLLIVP